jgi:uncharacterized membrane protein YraQ (UPF0718 family)
MNLTAIIINVISFLFLIAAFFKDRAKTKQALKLAVRSFFKITPTVLIIVVLIGLLLSFVPSSKISAIIGEQSGFSGVLIIALFGSVLHIPSLISFPLAASVLKSGASVTAVAAFVTTLTMIGILVLPLEIKELGKKMALLRNGLSFLFAIIIALIMGSVL